MLRPAFPVLLILLMCTACSDRSQTLYYVSNVGNDAWSGRLPAPNADSTDGPFATPYRAAEAVASEPGDVVFRGGTYYLSRSIVLSAAHAGTRDAPRSWTAFEGETPVFSGSRTLEAASSVSDERIRERLPAPARSQVVEYDLAAHGISDPGDFSDEDGPGLELFFNDLRQPRARYPNAGYLEIASVPQSGDSLYREGSFQWTRFGIPVGRHFGKLRFDDSRLRTWAPSDDIWMHGYFVWDWRDGFQRVASIDPNTGVVTAAKPFHLYGFHQGQRAYFFNVLEELDQPGEWVVDRQTGRVYFWPPAGEGGEQVAASVLSSPAFVLDSTSYVRIEHLEIEQTRSNGIVIRGGAHNTVAGCQIRNVGTTGIIVDGGEHHRILSNDLYQLGGGGVRVAGGDRPTLTPGRHLVSNNHVHHFGEVRLTTVPGIRVTGVRNTVSHNELHDSPDAGIFFFGNDLLLEYNEVHHIARESDDVGAFYIGRDYSMRGNVVRYNYVHHLEKPMHVGVMAVYLDDFQSGVEVTGNVFYKAGRCVFMGGGRSNVVENNVFVACTPSVFLDARGKVRNTEYFDGRLTTLVDRLEAMNYREPPYSEAYPELLGLYDDDPAMPKYNRVQRNVSMGGKWLGLYSGLPMSILDMTHNVISDAEVLRSSERTGVETDEFVIHTQSDTTVVAELESMGNIVRSDEPAVFDPGTGELDIPEDSPVLEAGFVPIPVDSIGLYVDAWRVRIPE
jgi:hypothetical protein